jgi:hypothetical protein
MEDEGYLDAPYVLQLLDSQCLKKRNPSSRGDNGESQPLQNASPRFRLICRLGCARVVGFSLEILGFDDLFDLGRLIVHTRYLLRVEVRHPFDESYSRLHQTSSDPPRDNSDRTNQVVKVPKGGG